MSSEKSGDSNHTLPGNVKIKVEPGTSLPVPLKNIKTEPGLPPATTSTRLTSFRLPRDLTLGANIKTEKPKRVYTPNLNAQRNKKKEDAGPVKQENARQPRGKDRGRGRGRGDRGRGRGTSNLVQSTGVWSEGITNIPGGSRRSGGGSRDGGDRSAQSCLEKPKLDLNRTVDKADEEEKLKALLRDDFIDDGEGLDLDNAPVMLPMIENAKLYKEEPKVEDIKPIVETEEEIDKKPIILENGEVLAPKKELKVKAPKTSVQDNLPATVPQVIETKTNSYILIQFPDCLPGLECSSEDTRPTPGRASEKEKQPKAEYCTLNSLKPGLLGKLQILRSGKSRLVLGENNLIVDVGSHLSFRQDLIAAKLDTENLDGELINLGPVSSTFICSPDWESMLAKL